MAATLLLPLEEWVALQEGLLEDERAAALLDAYGSLATRSAAELEAAGVALLRATVLDATTGLFGRSLLTLGASFGRPLPAHRFSPGDIVGLRAPGSDRAGPGAAAAAAAAAAGGTAATAAAAASIHELYDATGVVTEASEARLVVALEERAGGGGAGGGGGAPDAPFDPGIGDRLRVDRLADDVTFKRLAATPRELREAGGGGGGGSPAAHLLRVLFGCGADAPQPTFARSGAGDDWRADADLAADVARALADDSVVFRGGGGAPGSGGGDGSRSSGGGGRSFAPLNAGLNDGQRAAVAACLAARQLCMIHGPPGTGKTTAVVEYIRQEVARGRRVLACAPSNVACDNLAERLAAAGTVRLVRLGHPARVAAALQRHSLDAQVRAAEGTSIVRDVRAELAAVAKQARAPRVSKPERRALRGEERRLRGELRAREEAVVTGVLRSADVVLATCTGAATRVLRRALLPSPPAAGGASGGGGGAVTRGFDVVVIDEVAQAVEAACYTPALLAPKLVVAGDHCQLPPTILSDSAARRGLALTLADRIVSKFGGGAGEGAAVDPGGSGGGEQRGGAASAHGAGAAGPAADGGEAAQLETPREPPSPGGEQEVVHMLTPREPPTGGEQGGEQVVHMLTVQYRMHRHISDWASGAMYHGRLQPHASVAAHTLAGLPAVAAALAALPPPVDGDGAPPSVRVPAAALRRLHAAAAAEATTRSRAAAEAAGAGAGRGAAAASGGGRGGAGGGGGGGGGCGGGGGLDALLDALTTQAAALAAPAAAAAGGGSGGDADEPPLELDVSALCAPLLLLDTAGCAECGEARETAAGDSKANVGEADVVVKHVLGLTALGLRPQDMAVVTPYNAQVALLRSLLAPSFPGLEVKSVDSFQGQEREAIILSLVRSNTAHEVGFLADSRRLNVAVTRARRHCAIVADSETVSADPFIARLVAHAAAVGEVRSAAEYALAGVPAVRGCGAVDLARFEEASSALRRGKAAPARGQRAAAAAAAAAAPLSAPPTDPHDRARYEALRAQIAHFAELLRLPPQPPHHPSGDELGTAATAPTAAASSDFSAADAAAGADAATARPAAGRPVLVAAPTAVGGTVLQPPLPAATAWLVGAGSSSSRLELAPPGGAARGGGEGQRTPTSRLEFSPQLSSYERMLVHVAAAACGLRHASAGDAAGDGRCVVVFGGAPQPQPPLSRGAAAAGAAAEPRGAGVAAAARGGNAWATLAADADSDDEQVAAEAPTAGPPASSGGGGGGDDAVVVAGDGTVADEAVTAAALLLATAADVEPPSGPLTPPPPPQPSSETRPALAPSSATSSAAYPPSKKPVVTSGRLGTAADTASLSPAAAAAAASSLAAQLAAERRARAEVRGGGGTPAKPPTVDAGLPSLLGSSGSSSAGAVAPAAVKLGGAARQAAPSPPPQSSSPPARGLGTATTAAGGRAPGPGKLEMGLPVGHVKPLPPAQAPASKRKGGGSKAARGGGGGGGGGGGDDGDDDMALLEALAAESGRCAMGGCKASTQVVGCLCSHCRWRFCYEHGLPEVHGCGDAARSAARRAWTSGGGGMAAATGVPPASATALKGWQRDAVAGKLHKKLDAAASGRAPQAPPGDGKKR
jgi:hypothetical protein